MSKWNESATSENFEGLQIVPQTGSDLLDVVVCSATFDLEKNASDSCGAIPNAARHRKKAEGARGQTKRARVRARSTFLKGLAKQVLFGEGCASVKIRPQPLACDAG